MFRLVLNHLSFRTYVRNLKFTVILRFLSRYRFFEMTHTLLIHFLTAIVKKISYFPIHRNDKFILNQLIITIAIICFTTSAHPKNYELEIKSGVSREVLNYEEGSENLIIRGGLSLLLCDSFNFNFTTLRNITDDSSSFTWNLNLKDISGFCNFTSGNYNLHFGSGLMMGKPSYSSGDPFSKKISISKDQTISLSNGGNPEYSLYGAAFEFYKNFEETKIYFIPFCSIQRRFISYQSFDAGVIDSSLFSLKTKIKESGNYTEPVNIINYGGLFGLQTLSLFNFQIYYFETDLKVDSGKDILWDKDKYYAGSGIDLIRNSGFFAEYADKNISLFIEPAMSSIKNDTTVTDFALAWGIGIQNSIMNFAVKGKNCGTGFHSEYSSGSRTPERIWETRCGIYPIKYIETGFIIYSEKDLTPGYNKDYIEGSIQEELFTGVNTETIDININVRRRENYSNDRKESTDQGNLTFAVSPTDRFFFKIRSSSQRSSAGKSYLAGGEMKFLFLEYLSLSMGYARITVNGELPLYAVITPSSEHSSITAFRESAHGGSVNFRYRKEKDSFYVRVSIVKTESKLSGDVESALTLLF